MNFAIERNLRQLLVSLAFGELLNSDGSLRSKRGDSTPLRFQVGDRFGSAVTLATPLQIQFGAKVQGDDDGSYVVSNYDPETELFAYTFDSGTLYYTVSPSWNTAKLNNLLGFDPEGFAETTELRTVADVAGSLHTKTFVLHDQAGSVGVWFDVDAAGASTPAAATACARQIKINTVVTGDPASTVATKIATALAADSQFPTTTADFGDVVTIVDKFIGARTPAMAGDTGFIPRQWIAGSAPQTMANVDSVTLDGEFRFSENGLVWSTVTFPVIVSFDVNNGFAGVPKNATPAYPAPGRIVLTDTEQTITGDKHFAGDVDGLKAPGLTFTRTGTGTVARTLQEILDSGYATPEDFGAAGDGTTDDSAAIQKAADASRIVVFGVRTYRIGTAITFTAGQLFRGQGVDRTVLQLDDGIDGFTTSLNSTGFSHMTITGNGPSHLAGRGIALGNALTATGNTCVVEFVKFRYCALGFYNGYYDGVTLRNCLFRDNTANIKAENNVGPMAIENCIINDATGDGILAVSANIKMSGCNLNDNGLSGTGYAIRCTGSGSNVEADKIQFELVANNTPGAAYCYVDFNNGLTITNSIWQDGGIDFVHVVCHNGCLIRLQGNSVANNPNTTAGPIVNGSGVFDARSADFNGYVSYDSYNYRLCPWHTYNDGWTLPTASATSEDLYAVASSSGSGSQRLFAKREIAGVYSYVGIDGALAALDTADVAHGGTNLTSYTAGDLLYATGATTLAKLAKGSDGQVLTIDPTTHLPVWITPTKEVYGAVQSTTINMWASAGGSAWIDGAFHDVRDLQISNVQPGDYFVDVDIWYGMDASNTGIKWQLAGSATFTGGDYFERFASQDGTAMLTTNVVSGDSLAGNGSGTHVLRYHGTLNVTVAGTIKLQIGTPTAGDSGQFQKGSNLELSRR